MCLVNNLGGWFADDVKIKYSFIDAECLKYIRSSLSSDVISEGW